MNIDKINTAIRNGVDHCRGDHGNLSGKVAEFLSELNGVGWTVEDLFGVKIGMFIALDAADDAAQAGPDDPG